MQKAPPSYPHFIMLPEYSQWMYALVALLVVVLFRESQTRRKRLHLPPGPSPLPLIGNAFDMPRKHLGSEFYELTKKFGTSSPRCCAL